ncbi:MAG: hypothetical protein ACRDUB_00865 [Mycobacterium sp.]
MPADDLLRFIGAPLPPTWWWVALAASLITLVVAWVVGVIVWTLPPRRLRTIPLIRDLHAHLTRRRFVRVIGDTTRLHEQQAMSGPQAAANYSHALRTFLFLRTGVNVQYLHQVDLVEGPLAPALPLLGQFHDAQFNAESRADVAELARSAEEMIRTWS